MFYCGVISDTEVTFLFCFLRKSGRVNWRRREKRQQLEQHLILNQALKANQEVSI